MKTQREIEQEIKTELARLYRKLRKAIQANHPEESPEQVETATELAFDRLVRSF